MAEIVLRNVKGSPLTNQEVDDNFNNINVEVGTKLTASTYTAADVLTKIKTVDGSGSGLDADTIDGFQSATGNTVSTVVVRDSNGDFAAGTITATTLIGNVTGNITGNLTGTVTGNATNVVGTVAIANGGTGGTTESTARTNLGLGTIATQAASNVNITGGSITGITDLAIADGGTGASNASGARSNLGLAIGSDVQPFSNELTAIAGATAATGFYTRLGSGSVTERTFTAGTNGITITNGNGVSGNPVIDISTSAAISLISVTASSFVSVASIAKTGTNGTGDIGQTGNRFGTIFGTATSARYADLAERYTTDQEYEAGTVLTVALSGESEATACFESGQRVLGVVSTNPAFLMNDEAPGQAIALRGRVPVKVVGAIRKGQPLICNQDGKGIYGDTSNSFAIALESNEEVGVKLVECVIL
jgi:hypothetical protein